jgi:DNA-binding transcriptional ArsR family regulator
MSGTGEETYSTMFSSLRHPARRKILRMLSERSMTFSQILDELAIPSSHLTYHLENLGELVVKKEDGRYKLSSFGDASVLMMKNAEEVPEIQKKSFSSIPLRWKSLYGIFIIGILLLASMSYVQYASYNQLSKEVGLLKTNLEQAQSQNQQLLSWSGSPDKAMSIIKDVIQIDISKYQTALLSDTMEPRSDLGGVIEEVLKYSLVNTESRLDLVLRFRNDHFSLYQLTVLEGVPAYVPIYSQPQPTDFLAATRGLIERYTSFSNDSYLQQMRQLLASANETQDDQILGNTKLSMSIHGDNAQISLLYMENNTDFAAKSVQIVFENHVLTQLSDDWFLYTVGSTQVNISQDQAIQVAKTAAKSFTWNASGVQVSDFTVLQDPVSAVFFPHPRTDPLALIPYWFITLYLDKNYPGGVNSISVGVWADTGQVANIQALSNQTTA